MTGKSSFAAAALALLLVLGSGCSPYTELKNVQLIYATSLDADEKQGIVANVTIQSPGGKEREKPTHEVILASGRSLQESLFKKIALQIAGPIGTSKNQVILIGDKLARRDLAVTLDSALRSANDPLQSRLAIVPGDASKLIRMERIGSATVGEYLRKILDSAVNETDVPAISLHSLYPTLFDEGRDFVLPLLVQEGNKANVKGIALMNERRYTGYSLSQDQSSLFLLLDDKKGGSCVLTRQVMIPGKEADGPITVSFNILRAKRTKRVTVRDGEVRVKLHLALKASIVEYPYADLSEASAKTALGQALAKLIGEESNAVVERLKLANSDALGIGRDLIAFHPQAWKKLNWERDYKKTAFDVGTSFEIISHGIKN